VLLKQKLFDRFQFVIWKGKHSMVKQYLALLFTGSQVTTKPRMPSVRV
jgi:hypothetical protein